MDVMKTPNLNPLRNKHGPQQRGAAVLMLMLIVMLGLITLFSLRMDRKGPELNADRQTALALAQAKEAILGRGLINGIPTGTKQNPGALPCPDRDNDGQADNILPAQCNGKTPTSILPINTGRVPWLTLAINVPRDGTSETLWYIIAPEFVDTGSAINSSITIPTLQLVQNGTATPVAGVIIAPGRPLPGQDRTAPNTLSNYVEGYDATTNTFTVSPTSATYNDRVLPITAREVFTIVTRRMTRELAQGMGGPPYPPAPILPSASTWTQNNWGSALSSYIVSGTAKDKITLSYKNCLGQQFTILWNTTTNTNDVTWKGSAC